MPLTQLHQSINDHWRNEEALWATVIQSQTKCTRSEALRVAHRIITRQARNEPDRVKLVDAMRFKNALSECCESQSEDKRNG